MPVNEDELYFLLLCWRRERRKRFFVVVGRSPADFLFFVLRVRMKKCACFSWREESKSVLWGEHLGSMKQSYFLLIERAENLGYVMFGDLEVGCRWGARDATSVTEAAFSKSVS